MSAEQAITRDAIAASVARATDGRCPPPLAAPGLYWTDSGRFQVGQWYTLPGRGPHCYAGSGSWLGMGGYRYYPSEEMLNYAADHPQSDEDLRIWHENHRAKGIYYRLPVTGASCLL